MKEIWFCCAVLQFVSSFDISDLNFEVETINTNSTTIMDIFNEVVQNHIFNKEIVMFGEELENSVYGVDALHLDWPKTIIQHNFKNSKQLKGLMILFPSSDFHGYERVLKGPRGYNSLNYLIFTRKFSDIVKLFDLMWGWRIIDVAALYYSESGRLYVFTFHPFSSKGCSHTYPVKINMWDEKDKQFANKGNIFSRKKKLYNLYGCPIRVSLRDRGVEELNQKSTRGISIRLFKFIRDYLNFSSHVVELDREANAYAAAYLNFSTASILSVIKGETDMGLGTFSQLIDYDPNIAFPVELNTDCFTWAVPVKAGAKPSMWTMYAYEFDWCTWGLLLLNHFVVWGIFLVLFRICQFQKDPFTSNFHLFYLFASYISAPVKTKPTLITLKVFYIHWVFFSFVMVSAYQASMGSFVTVPPDGTEIDSTASLLKSNLALTGDPRMYHVLSASSETSDSIKEILDRFVILLPGDFNDVIYRLQKDRNIAVFYTKYKLEVAEQHVMQERSTSRVIHILPGCTIISHNSAIIMKKDSLYLEPFSYVMSSLLESGIINYWSLLRSKKSFELSKGNESKGETFSLLHVKAIFIIFICGHLLAITAFIIELLSKGINVRSE